MSYELHTLHYKYDALEPYIDAKTMEIHHTKHHAAYLEKLNGAIAGTELENIPLEQLLSKISQQPALLRNNAGGYYNHNLFWTFMKPGGGGRPTGELAQAITKYFGSLDAFKEQFTKAAIGQFGSGWAWLIAKPNGELAVTSTPNQDNPLMDINPVNGKILLGLDVWEHAYYLKYQNRRAEYIAAFWNVVNWENVALHL